VLPIDHGHSKSVDHRFAITNGLWDQNLDSQTPYALKMKFSAKKAYQNSYRLNTDYYRDSLLNEINKQSEIG